MGNKCLLSDSEIVNLSNENDDDKLISPFQHEGAKGGSYVLHIGSLHKPKSEPYTKKSDGKNEWVLQPGQMALIVTREKLHIPHNMIGIVFGKNNITMSGLLIVNPGIITAGHEREITFYVINFSCSDSVIIEDEPIARIAFLRSENNEFNPDNAKTNAKHDAERHAKKNFYPDFSGYFNKLIHPTIKRVIYEVIAIAFGFGVLASIASVVNPIIAERMQHVPQIQQDIAEIKSELATIKANSNKDTSETDPNAPGHVAMQQP